MLKKKGKFKLTDKQFNWSEKVIKGIKENNLNIKEITDETYNGSDKCKSVVAARNKKKENIVEYISTRLKELELYRNVKKEDIENRLSELILGASTKASDVSSLAKTLGDYKGYNKPAPNTLIQQNLYNISDEEAENMTQTIDITKDK